MGVFQVQSVREFDARRKVSQAKTLGTKVNNMPVVQGRMDSGSADKVNYAFSVLQYNQDFVKFIDGKANSLLLVNSIFLATSASTGLESTLARVAAVVATTAVLLCLAVVYARSAGAGERSQSKLIFFGHILQRRNAATFTEDFIATSNKSLLESTTAQIYDLAGVVDRKFNAYRRAQTFTLFSAALWISNLLIPALNIVK